MDSLMIVPFLELIFCQATVLNETSISSWESNQLQDSALESLFQIEYMNEEQGSRHLQYYYQCSFYWNCSHGQCIDRICQCDLGYEGYKCDQRSTTSNTNNNSTDSNSDSSMSTGAVAGIVIATFISILFLLWCICYRSKKPQVKLQINPVYNPVQNAVIYPKMAQIIEVKPHQDLIIEQVPGQTQNCSICLDDIIVNQLCQVNCPFRHTFHQQCIKQWVLNHKTCPQCRGQISL